MRVRSPGLRAWGFQLTGDRAELLGHKPLSSCSNPVRPRRALKRLKSFEGPRSKQARTRLVGSTTQLPLGVALVTGLVPGVHPFWEEDPVSKAWKDGHRRMSDWRRTRLMVLDRDGWVCGNCGKQMTQGTPKDSPDAPQVHHLRGAEHGDDPQYLVSCCRACNLSIGSPKSQDPKPRPRTKW